ncbi:MAG TPA: LptE family protein [Rhizomicrobium sp.]|nr:LptE family protein [Rhizomicrobium sp.]
MKMSAGYRLRFATVIVVACLLLGCGCGYHTSSGTAVRLPSDLHTIYVPTIVNNSQSYRLGQTLTEAVVRELRTRTNYRVVTTNDGTADATLSGNITQVFIAPLTYDPQTERIASSMVAVGLSASLKDKDGKVLWSNPNFLYREQYEESTDARTFFEEAGPAVQRVANSFAKTLVADILEAF